MKKSLSLWPVIWRATSLSTRNSAVARESVSVFDLAEASHGLRRFPSERASISGLNGRASPGTSRWFPAHVRVFMASELECERDHSRSRTTRENRVTALPPKRIAHYYYRQTRARNSHTRSPKIGVARRDAENPKRPTRMKRRKRKSLFPRSSSSLSLPIFSARRRDILGRNCLSHILWHRKNRR